MIARTHRIDIFDPPAEDADPYDAMDSGWTTVANDVEVNLQPVGGTVRQAAAGREVEADVQGFAPAGTAFAPDQGVVVTAALMADAGMVGEHFRISSVGPQGGRWDTEFLLRRTEEEVG